MSQFTLLQRKWSAVFEAAAKAEVTLHADPCISGVTLHNCTSDPSRSLSVFMRSLAGMDRTAAKDAGHRQGHARRRATVSRQRRGQTMMEHNGYIGAIEFDPSIDAFHGRVLGLQDVVTFQGRSLDELRREMAESVDDYLEFCAKVGKDPERAHRCEGPEGKAEDLTMTGETPLG